MRRFFFKDRVRPRTVTFSEGIREVGGCEYQDFLINFVKFYSNISCKSVPFTFLVNDSGEKLANDEQN